jgi:hypothetical protein
MLKKLELLLIFAILAVLAAGFFVALEQFAKGKP